MDALKSNILLEMMKSVHDISRKSDSDVHIVSKTHLKKKRKEKKKRKKKRRKKKEEEERMKADFS